MMKTFALSLLFCTPEIVVVFITLYKDSYGIHCKRVLFNLKEWLLLQKSKYTLYIRVPLFNETLNFQMFYM